MLRYKVPAYTSLLTLAVGAICAFLLMGYRTTKTSASATPSIAAQPTCDYSIKRIQGFGHVQPLMSAEPVCEGPRFAALKASVIGLIGAARNNGAISRASVYVKDLERADWFSINGDDRYEPASLMKVPSMITALMSNEADASFSKRSFRASGSDVQRDQYYAPSQEPEIGKDYTFDQVLRYSIVNSSNIAEAMLLRQTNVAQYRRLLSMVGLEDITANQSSYPVSPKEYAQFFKVIYSTAVLSPLNAEWALDLLIASDFKQGIRRGVPATVEVASKFGEAGMVGDRQLHEAAIVFAPGRTYLVVVMTNGREIAPLADLITSISSEVYGSMTGTAVVHN